MDERQTMNGQAAGLMLLLCMLWGFQQIALKATAGDITPLMQIALRSGVSAVLVGALMLWQRQPLALHDGSWRPGLVVGALFALEFLLIGEGLRHTTASHLVVFLYSAPIFAALGLHHRLPAERLSALQWLGIALAFGGIALAFFWRAQPAAGAVAGGSAADMLWGDLLALLAGAAWGATTVVVRCTRLSSTPATKTLLYQLVGAFVLLTPAAFVFGQAAIHFTPVVWASLVFHSLVISFGTFLTWFWLLRKFLAAQLQAFSFMTPLFGVAFGVWLLNEPLEPSFVAGALLVLIGITLVSGHGWLRQIAAARAARGLGVQEDST